MAVIAVTALCFSLCFSALEVVLPLWVTRELGYSAGQWAQLRSLRLGGVLAGVVVLGALSDRFGQRRLGMLAMGAGAAVLGLIALGLRHGIWAAMPVLGAFMSTAFVNLNTLTQQVSARRQGVANAIYRSVGAAAGMVGPVVATALAAAWEGYEGVFAVLAGWLILSAMVLRWYPGEPPPPPLGRLGQELKGLWATYRKALGQRALLQFVCLSSLWYNLVVAVSTFAAIRFTRELGCSDQEFGLLAALAAGVSLVATAAGALFLDRVRLRSVHVAVGLAASAASVVMGLSDGRLLSAVGYVAFVPLQQMLIAPTSMWVSRTAGAGAQAAAFTVQKIASALYMAVAMLLLSLLEQWIGMRAIFLYGGGLAAVVALGFLMLKEPAGPLENGDSHG